MKTLTLNLAKKLLILDYETKENMDSFLECGFTIGHKDKDCKFLFKGSEMTEEDYRSLITDKDGDISISKHPLAYLVSYSRHKNAFKDLIEKEGFYWLDNPIKHPEDFDNLPASLSVYAEMESKHNEAEEKTLRFPIIFEILE